MPDLQFYLGALVAQDTERKRAEGGSDPVSVSRSELAKKGRQEFFQMLKREL